MPYPKKDDEVNNPFYDQLTTIHVNALLDYVDQQTHFMKAFTHIKQHRSKTIFDRQCIKGCIIADGTGLGIFKMAEACDLGYKSMLNSHHDFIRLETLRNANDIISNTTAALPIFKYYNSSEDVFHGSADAQKYRVKRDTFNSRHSQKYFSTAKGVAPYTLILNHVPINCNMRGSHEHESHNLYDLLFNSDSGFDLDRVSTDTAGSNQVNFALLDARYIDYTPCYKFIGTKVSRICTFNDPETYKNFLIKPAYQVDEKLIIEEWPNILPIYAALMMKETTQGVVVKKLCSHFRKSSTKSALWEYNNILMSIYLLRYIDDPILRQHVRVALNRGEAYHQLRRAIAEANGKEFRGGSDTEIAIWNECGRLIANAVIFYNAYLLSRLMEIKERQSDIEAIQSS